MEDNLKQAINTMSRAMNGSAAAYRPYLQELINAAHANERLTEETHNWAAAVKKLEAERATQPAPLADAALTYLSHSTTPASLSLAVEVLELHSVPDATKTVKTVLEALPGLLARLRATEAPKWVPAIHGKSLPEKIGHYLCLCNDGAQIVCFLNVVGDWSVFPGAQYYGDLAGNGEAQPDRTVTHWQPLPAAPAQAGKEAASC
jgi:hypothetical protein